MGKISILSRADELRELPLCGRYRAIFFGRLSLCGVAESATAHLWALGIANDDSYEALGVWPTCDGDARPMFDDLHARGVEDIDLIVGPVPSDVTSGLKALYPTCGAIPSLAELRIKTVAEVAPRYRRPIADALHSIINASTIAVAQAALQAFASGHRAADYLGTVGHMSSALAELHPYYALPMRLRSRVVRADAASHAWVQTLARASQRRSPSPDPALVTAFTAKSLVRLEQRLQDRREARSRMLPTERFTHCSEARSSAAALHA